MALCSTPLTPECEKEIARLIDLMPEVELDMLVATEPAFQRGGFRAGNIPVLRKRLHQIVCGAGEVSDKLRCILARRSRTCTLTGLIAIDTLIEARHAFAALLGAPALLVALLLDDRDEVQEYAEDWMQRPDAFHAIEPDKAVEYLRDLFTDLHSLLGRVPDGDDMGVTLTREAWLAQKERLEQRLRDFKTENRRLKGVEGQLKNLQREKDEVVEQRDTARQREKELGETLRQSERKLEEVTVELKREQTHREERVAAAVDRALAQEFHGWLGQAREVERDVHQTAPHAELLARAQVALSKQAEADRHSGNRARLTERREQVAQTLATVRAALRNALRPTADLQAVESELAAEMLRLDNLLNPDAPASALEDALTARFQDVGDNALPRLRTFLDDLAKLHVLDAPAMARLKEAFQRRIAAIKALGVPPPPQAEDLPPEAALLSRALCGETPAILLLDGHNVLYGLPSRYNPPRGASLIESKKREMLVRDVVRLVSATPTLRTQIVFDGPTYTDEKAAPNVTVTYSGGEGEHRADNVLLDNIRFHTLESSEIPILLVTNDNDFRAKARRLGAQCLSVPDFGAFIPH